MKLVSSLDELRREFADAVVDSDGWFATALDLMFAAECLERPPRCPPSRAPTSAARPVPRLFCSGRRGTLPQPARSPIPCLPPLAGHVTDLVIKIPTDSGGRQQRKTARVDERRECLKTWSIRPRAPSRWLRSTNFLAKRSRWHPWWLMQDMAPPRSFATP